MFQKATSPIGMVKIFTDSIKLYKSTLLHTIIFSFIAALVSAHTVVQTADDHNFVLNTMMMYRLDWQFVIYSFLVLLVVIWAYGAIFYQINQVMNQEKTNVLKASLHGLIQLPSFLVTMILYMVIFVIGCMLLLIPGIIFGVSCILSVVLAGLGEKNPINALINSHRLVWPHWWRALVLSVIPFLFFLLIGFVGNFLMTEAFIHSGHSLSFLLMIRVVASVVLGCFYAPWFYGLMVLVLNDFKIRSQLDPKTKEKFVDNYDDVENFLEKNT